MLSTFFLFENFSHFSASTTFSASFYTCFVYFTLLTFFRAFVSSVIKHFIFRLQNEKLTYIRVYVYIYIYIYTCVVQYAYSYAIQPCTFVCAPKNLLQGKQRDIFRFYFYESATVKRQLLCFICFTSSPIRLLLLLLAEGERICAKQIESADIQGRQAALRCNTVFIEVYKGCKKYIFII